MRVRDTLHAEAPSPDAQPEQAAGDPFMAVDGHCAPEAEVLLKSIMLRAAFGGMAGDIEMLNGFTAVWRHRCACFPQGSVRMPTCTISRASICCAE